MQDVAGRNLILGDRVAVTSSGEMRVVLGEIVKFTPKGCRVILDRPKWTFGDGDGSVVRTADQLVLIEHNPAREAELTTSKTKPLEI